MYACLQKQVTYVATTKNLVDDICANKSIDYSSGKTSNVFKDTTTGQLRLSLGICHFNLTFNNESKLCTYSRLLLVL